MKQITVLLVKFISCIIAFAIGLDLFFDATIVDILSFSLFVTIVSYMAGDRILLRYFGNTAAIVGEFLLTYLSVWIFGNILLNSYMQIAWGSILSAIIVAAAEVLVHRYFHSHVPKERISDRHQRNFNPKLSFETEFAEEENIRDKDFIKE